MLRNSSFLCGSFLASISAPTVGILSGYRQIFPSPPSEFVFLDALAKFCVHGLLRWRGLLKIHQSGKGVFVSMPHLLFSLCAFHGDPV
ncbi:hypothetical protein Dimus_011646 [Dionaea muscipula]